MPNRNFTRMKYSIKKAVQKEKKLKFLLKKYCKRNFLVHWVLKIIKNVIEFPFLLVWILIRFWGTCFLPIEVNNGLIFGMRTFFRDLFIQQRNLKLAIKRFKLIMELHIKGRERFASFGEKNPDKVFFVIRPYYFTEENEIYTSVSNLLFQFYRMLQHLSYAVENNWIPVVDWVHYGKFAHQEDYPVHGTTDCWAYFWKQPSAYTLDEVYQSKNVILSDQNTRDYGFIPPTSIKAPFLPYATRIAQLCPKYTSLIEFNNDTLQYINQKEKEVFGAISRNRILGVSIRAMSYGAYSVQNHPRQPSVEELIDKIASKMDEWDMDACYFACESEIVVNRLKEAFDDKIVTLPRLRYKKKTSVGDTSLYEPGQKYQTNLDYLTEMVLLSRCACLLAGMSGGVRMAIAWNGGQFKHMEFFEKGLW